MTKSTTYNGWRNRPTWNAHLWLTNDEALYWPALNVAREPRTLREAAKAIRLHCADLWPEGATPDGDRLSAVRWVDVARALREK